MAKSSAKEFFKPTKWKIVISILIPILFGVLGVSTIFLQYVSPTPISSNGTAYIIPTYVQNNIAFSPAIVTLAIIGFFLFAAFSYPFSCSLLAIWNRYKHHDSKQLKGAFLALTLIGIIIFNPLGARILSVFTTYYAWGVYFLSFNTPCGVAFTGFVPNYPAEKSGLKTDEIISSVNGIAVRNISTFQNFINNSKPGNSVIVQTTDGKSFQMTLAPNPTNPKIGAIGISNPQTGYCKKA